MLRRKSMIKKGVRRTLGLKGVSEVLLQRSAGQEDGAVERVIRFDMTDVTILVRRQVEKRFLGRHNGGRFPSATAAS
jgi:hypothetical protein